MTTRPRVVLACARWQHTVSLPMSSCSLRCAARPHLAIAARARLAGFEGVDAVQPNVVAADQ